jgi:hypothetical protein
VGSEGFGLVMDELDLNLHLRLHNWVFNGLIAKKVGLVDNLIWVIGGFE